MFAVSAIHPIFGVEHLVGYWRVVDCSPFGSRPDSKSRSTVLPNDGFVGADGYWSYGGLRYLEEGDDFTVYAKNGSVLWHGIVHQDTKTGAVPRQVIRKGRLVNDRTWK